MVLTSAGLEKLAATHRKMLRNIIGWSSFHKYESWQERGHHIKIALQDLVDRYSIKLWSALALHRGWTWAERINSMHPDRWGPRLHLQDNQISISKRSRGRPRQRWEDHLNMFSMYHGFARMILLHMCLMIGHLNDSHIAFG